MALITEAKNAGKKEKQGFSKANVVLSIIIIILLFFLLSLLVYAFFSLREINFLLRDFYVSNVIQKATSQKSGNGCSVFNTLLGNKTIEIIQDGNPLPGAKCYYTYVCINETVECEEECVEDNQTCMNDSQCCSGCCNYISNGIFQCQPKEQCETCRTYDEPCAINNTECCSGYCCKNGKCRPIQECCVQENLTCVNSSQCCYGLECINSLCGSREGCNEIKENCTANKECCSECCKYVGNGITECVPAEECCKDEGSDCKYDSDCCGDLDCINETCQPPCMEHNEICKSNDECCSGCCHYSDGTSTCQPLSECCKHEQELCKSNDECCSGLFCNDYSVCQKCITGGYSCYDPDSCCSPYKCTSGMCVL